MFGGPFSGTTRVSRYQKGKTNLDFTEAWDTECRLHQLGHMQVCTLLQTDNHASTPPLIFLQARCPSCHPINSVKALKANQRQVFAVVVLLIIIVSLILSLCINVSAALSLNSEVQIAFILCIMLHIFMDIVTCRLQLIWWPSRICNKLHVHRYFWQMFVMFCVNKYFWIANFENQF